VRWLGSNAIIVPRLKVKIDAKFDYSRRTQSYLLAKSVAQFVKQDHRLLKICLANGAELSPVLRSVPANLNHAKHAASREAWSKLLSKLAAPKIAEIDPDVVTDFVTDVFVTEVFVTQHSDVDLVIDRIALFTDPRLSAYLNFNATVYKRLLNNPRVALALAYQGLFRCIDERLKTDKRFVLKAASVNSSILSEVEEKFKNDYDVVLAAVTRNGDSIWLASAEMRRNKTIVLAAIGTCNTVPDKTMPEMCNNKEVMLAAVKKNGLNLGVVSPALQTDVELVVAAVRQNIDAMMHVHPDLFDNKEVQRSIIERWGPTEFSRNAQKYDWHQADSDKSCD
jgi:hypothetical protein